MEAYLFEQPAWPRQSARPRAATSSLGSV